MKFEIAAFAACADRFGPLKIHLRQMRKGDPIRITKNFAKLRTAEAATGSLPQARRNVDPQLLIIVFQHLARPDLRPVQLLHKHISEKLRKIRQRIQRPKHAIDPPRPVIHPHPAQQDRLLLRQTGLQKASIQRDRRQQGAARLHSLLPLRP